MDWQAVVNIISTIGFPIVAACAMWYYATKEAERHKEEMNAVNEAISNNTIALVKLSEKIDNLGGHKNGNETDS